MANLITAKEVIELAFAENSNMREESISDTSIRIAEIKYIKPVFGNMYSMLGTTYADFTNEYIKPALAYFVKCEIVSSIAIDMSNSGVAVANPQYQSAASDKQRQRLYDSEIGKAKVLLDDALAYISAHAEEFPDFGGLAPKRHYRNGGLILGNGVPVKPTQLSADSVSRKEFDALKGRVEDLEESGGGGGNSDNNYTDADKDLVDKIPELEEELDNKVDTTTFDETIRNIGYGIEEFGNSVAEALENKADKKGYYKDLSVGMADNLVGRGDVQDAHINFRPSAGAANITDGAARIERIKGNSVVWNNFAGDYIGASATANLQSGAHIVKGHKYLFHRTITSGILYLIQKVDGVEKYDCKLTEGVDSLIYTALYDLSTPNISLYNTIQVQGGIHLIDLTKMFGAGNEPKTVEEYHQRKPMNIEDEFAYNEGTLVDMHADELVSTGDNAYNKTTHSARVMGSVRYDISDSIGTQGLEVGFWQDADTQGDYELVDVQTDARGQQYCIFPANGYCDVSGGNGDYGVCLNHSYHKAIKPFEQVTKDFSWIWEIEDGEGGLLFPNGMRSASAAPNNNWHIYDEIFFNKTIKKWTLIKRIGSTTVTKDTPIEKNTNAQCAFTVNRQNLQLDGTPKTYGGCTTNNYGWARTYSITTKGLYFNDSLLIFNLGDDSNVTTIEALKSLLETRPLHINYELETPIVVELDYPTAETNMDYLAWDFGTEEAIASVPSAPFRADINYEPNAVDDLRWAVSEIRSLKAQLAQMQTSATNLTE